MTSPTRQPGPATAKVAPLSDADARALAARFVGCDAAVLRVADKQPEAKTYNWGVVQDSVWVGTCPGPNPPRAEVRVTVERAMGYVHIANWEYPPDAASKSKPPTLPTDAAAQEAAAKLMRDRGGLPVEDGKIRLRTTEYPPDREYQCQAEGHLPDGHPFSAIVVFHFDLSRPISYLCNMLPPEPPAKDGAQITEQEALAIARQHAETVKNWDVVDVHLDRLSTQTPFAPVGTLVYQVSIIEGRRAPAGRPRGLGGHTWGVNAATGEVIEEPRFLPGQR